MLLVDANVLAYASNEDAREHTRSRSWLESALKGRETVGFTWTVLLAYLRLSTHPAVFEQPLSSTEAVADVELWMSRRPAVVVESSPRHLALLGGLLAGVGTAGNLVNDAHLAALALENDATVVSFDRDFGRFEGVRWQLPG